MHLIFGSSTLGKWSTNLSQRKSACSLTKLGSGVLFQTTDNGFNTADMFVGSGIWVESEGADVNKRYMEILTDNDIGLASLLFDQGRRVEIAEHNAHIGVCLRDSSCFGTISHESTDMVVWISCLENVEHVPANEPSGTSPIVEWRSACYSVGQWKHATYRKIRAIIV